MNRLDRTMGMLLLLRGGRVVSASELAKRFEVSVRTVYRDIQALCEAGVPVVTLPGQGYALTSGYFLPPLMFTGLEAGALALGEAGVAVVAATGPAVRTLALSPEANPA